jgi:glycosyltransferase involved in cell wall biosynthesis
MKLSVEISTYNRKDVLRLVLDRLAKQTCPFEEFEVVISDDGSTDGTSEMINAVKDSMPYTIRYLANEHRGCGYTHNRGIRAAKGDIILMLADDLLPEPQLIQEHMLAHKDNPESAVFVVGKLKQSPELSQTAIHKNWDPITGRDPEGKMTLSYRDFWVSNISFKKNFMLENGMFCEWPAASHEDLELGYRLEQKGAKLIFIPQALGYHYHAITIKSLSARNYMFGYNWHYLQDHVPDLWIRLRAGNVRLADGLGVYLISRMEMVLTRIFINKFTISFLTIPLLQKAEHNRLIVPMVPILRKVLLYYSFHKGRRDYEKIKR